MGIQSTINKGERYQFYVINTLLQKVWQKLILK
jgi:hypothetical protein